MMNFDQYDTYPPLVSRDSYANFFVNVFDKFLTQTHIYLQSQNVSLC